MATKNTVSVAISQDTDTRVQRYGRDKVFRVQGFSVATGKPVAPSKLSGLVTAHPTVHEVETRRLGQVSRSDRDKVWRPALSLSFSPRAVGAVNSRGYTDELEVKTEADWARVLEVFPRAIRSGMFNTSYYVPEPFSVNGRAFDTFTASLEFYPHSDGHGYQDHPTYNVGTVAGVQGAWSLHLGTSYGDLSDAAREMTERVALAVAAEFSDAEYLSQLMDYAAGRAARAREFAERYATVLERYSDAEREWSALAGRVAAGDAGTLDAFDAADAVTATAERAREDANRWSGL